MDESLLSVGEERGACELILLAPDQLGGSLVQALGGSGQRALPAIESSLECSALYHVRLRTLDFGDNSRKLFERVCTVNTVRQTKIQAGIHGGRDPLAEKTSEYGDEPRGP